MSRVFKIKRKETLREHKNSYSILHKDVPIWNALTDPYCSKALSIDCLDTDRSKDGKDRRYHRVIRGDGKEYTSVKEAALDNNITYGTICDCLRGRIKTAGGWQWKRAKRSI